MHFLLCKGSIFKTPLLMHMTIELLEILYVFQYFENGGGLLEFSK
uniref:Uncharacterized protein n=1 Tax=Rhizophora mucronata TaxID=61149 RepID=A0A2P2N718_RHIMU